MEGGGSVSGGGVVGDDAAGTLAFTVRFSGRSIPISLSEEATVRDLKSILQPLTNVLTRGQRLIFKGKVMADDMTLKSLELTNRCKVMLVASHGLHQGDGPIIKEASEPTRTRRIAAGDDRTARDKLAARDSKVRSDHWKLTGVVALSECRLKVIPDEVWDCGTSVRVLDVSKNLVRDVPAQIGSLSSTQKLFLNANDILDDSISWESLASLKCLTVLSLSENYLTLLPSSLGALTCLRQLHLANNKLTTLPVEIGFLSQLQILKANNNRLTSVPSSIGNCNSLVELDLSSNLLVELPETLGNLQNLKVLYLSNNGLKSIPPILFKKCSKLSTLDLHGTEITMDLLRGIEGWEDFDNRRRTKHQKQIDFGLGFTGGFDEGADKD